MNLYNMGLTDKVIGVEPDKPEDISEIRRLENPPEPLKVGQKVGRNDPCPCGSGKKFKKCCMVDEFVKSRKSPFFVIPVPH